MSLNGKVALLTGASSGIGAAIAIKFAEEGAKVAIVGRNEEKLNNVTKKCGNPLVLVADVTKEEDAKRIVNETVKHFGKLDILVNNAGTLYEARIQAEDAMTVFDQVMLTNLRAPVYLTHLAAPHLVSTKGNIVNISSITELTNFTYGTSKAALDHFTKCAAHELASSGVRVNAIQPGPVYSDALANLGVPAKEQEDLFDRYKQATALNRMSDAEEIADLALLLASDKAKAITGSAFVSDNGSLLKHIDIQ